MRMKVDEGLTERQRAASPLCAGTPPRVKAGDGSRDRLSMHSGRRACSASASPGRWGASRGAIVGDVEQRRRTFPAGASRDAPEPTGPRTPPTCSPTCQPSTDTASSSSSATRGRAQRRCSAGLPPGSARGGADGYLQKTEVADLTRTPDPDHVSLPPPANEGVSDSAIPSRWCANRWKPSTPPMTATCSSAATTTSRTQGANPARRRQRVHPRACARARPFLRRTGAKGTVAPCLGGSPDPGSHRLGYPGAAPDARA